MTPTQSEIDAQNAATSAREVAQFKARPLPYGETYRAYLTRDASGAHRITTWTGETLATVTSISSYAAPRSWWISNVRGSFRARGIDGRAYYGRHRGVGICCTLRLCKGQS